MQKVYRYRVCSNSIFGYKKDSAKSSNIILKESFRLLSIQELGNVKFAFIFMLSVVFSLAISIQIDAALL